MSTSPYSMLHKAQGYVGLPRVKLPDEVEGIIARAVQKEKAIREQHEAKRLEKEEMPLFALVA